MEQEEFDSLADGSWKYEIESLRRRLQDGSPVVEATIQHMALRITELESCIKSHGIPVKTYSDGVAHYCTKDEI